jgi:hypothetical protein
MYLLYRNFTVPLKYKMHNTIINIVGIRIFNYFHLNFMSTNLKILYCKTKIKSIPCCSPIVLYTKDRLIHLSQWKVRQYGLTLKLFSFSWHDKSPFQTNSKCWILIATVLIVPRFVWQLHRWWVFPTYGRVYIGGTSGWILDKTCEFSQYKRARLTI